MSPPSWLLWSVLMAFVHIVPSTSGLKLAAFNLHRFGPKKSSNTEVMGFITQIVSRYDIILIQEITDKPNTAINKLLAKVNKNLKKGEQYKKVSSERLGREESEPYKEQYAFLYREKDIEIVGEPYTYLDPEDIFEREPFAVKVKTTRTEVCEFALVGLHTDPCAALREIDKVPEVVTDIKRKLEVDNVIIMGDLNADCRYASKKGLNNSPLRDKDQFHWLIPDDADTTVAESDCAYDRLIVTVGVLKDIVKEGSAKVFKFDEENVCESEQALNVSDHYPVEMELEETGNTTCHSTSFYSTTPQSTPVYPITPQSTPVYPTTLQSAPVYPITLQSAPVYQTTLQSTPVYPTTTQSTPVHPTTTQSTPVYQTTPRSTPVYTTTPRSTPVYTSTQSTPVYMTTRQSTPVDETTEASTPGL